jgi:hypothetical protein
VAGFFDLGEVNPADFEKKFLVSLALKIRICPVQGSDFIPPEQEFQMGINAIL